MIVELATTVVLPGKAFGMDVVLAGGVTRAIVSTSGECNVFDDARATSSSISAADKENNREGRYSRYAPRVVPEGQGDGAGPVVVTGRARGTTLQGVLAASSVVGIARIIKKMCNICGDKTCLVLLLFIIHSLTPPPQSSTLSST